MTPRTLVISDLHVGMRDGFSVLERPVALELLLNALQDCERLVLLGDLVELQEAQAAHSLATVRPILQAIGAQMGPEREILFLPGNHDRQLIRGWIEAQGRAMRSESVVPPDASPPLRDIVEQLAPARVEVRYPGAWLSERIWAHHGHYLNRFLVPDQSYGVMPRRERRGGDARRVPADFEPRWGRRGGVRTLVRRLPRRAAAGIVDVEEVMRAATMPAPVDGGENSTRSAQDATGDGGETIHNPPIEMTAKFTDRLHERILHPSLSPMVSHLLGLQVRRHSVPAVARVAHDLGLEPDYVLFGHVHRLGPISGDDPGEWRWQNTRILNTGSWRWEPVLVQRARPPHPYWPGGAILIDEQGEPHAIGLLDSLSRDELTGKKG